MTLRDLRKRKYPTMQAFADKLGVDIQRVAKWEKRTSSPHIKDLPKVAKALGVSVTRLVGVLNGNDDI